MDAVAGPDYANDTDQLKAEVRRLHRLLREAEAEIERLEPLVDLDALVPAFNRRAFAREVDRTAAYCRRYSVTAALVHIDVQQLAVINDRYGQLIGDKVLQHVAGVLMQSTRKSDVIGRIDGDEFGVLLVRTDAACGRLVAERLRAEIANTPLKIEGHTIRISATAGVALVDGGASAETVMQLADQTMSSARQAMMSGSN